MSRTAKPPTRCDLVLNALRAAGELGCTTADLCQASVGGSRFGGRVCDLRKAGHEITSDYLREGSYVYRLVCLAPEPAPVSPNPKRAPVAATAPTSDVAPQVNLFDLIREAA